MNAASVTSSQTPADTPCRAVAPAWHTAIVLLVLLGFSFAGAHTHRLTPHGRAAAYLAVMTMEWLIVAFIWFGLSRRRIRVADLVGGAWPRPAVFFRDLGIAVSFVLLFGGAILSGLAYVVKASPPREMQGMMPQSLTELLLWVLMSLTAGFCEELIFRGYFLRQFTALTQSAVAGIVLQGIAFGLGHGYQGWKLMSLIAIYGMMFGWLARWRRSLRPGMLGHALQDTAGGLLARFFMR